MRQSEEVLKNLNGITYLWSVCPIPFRVIMDGTFFLHLLLFSWFSMRTAIWDLIRANFWCFGRLRIVFGRRVGVSEKCINITFCVRGINFLLRYISQMIGRIVYITYRDIDNRNPNNDATKLVTTPPKINDTIYKIIADIQKMYLILNSYQQ